MLRLGASAVWRYRLHVNHLTERLAAGEYARAARIALQDSCPRSGLLSLHARVEGCPSSAWQDASLAQTYSPRAAVHLVPRADFGVFTVGRLPSDPVARQAIETTAEEICAALGEGARRTWDLPERLRHRLRAACASGRIELRWDARSLSISARPRPPIGLIEAGLELARRHLHYYGPTTPEAFARWSGRTPTGARDVWSRLTDLAEIDVDGTTTWLALSDVETLRTVPSMRGVRFLPAEERRLLDAPRPSRHDTFHPHSLLVDGELIGSWGRRGGAIHVLLDRPIPRRTREAIESEATRLPVPAASIRLRITEYAA